MCLFPVHIYTKNMVNDGNTLKRVSICERRIGHGDVQKFLNWQHKHYDGDGDIYRRIRGYRVNETVVPCGKCSECLKKRQRSFSVRCMREAEKRGSMSFVTLTYRNDTLPLSVKLEYYDTETGEQLGYSTPMPMMRYKGCESEVKYKIYRDIITSKLKSNSATKCRVAPRHYVNFPSPGILEEEGVFVRQVITPCIWNRDLQLWIKKCRVRYERTYFRHLDFSYAAVGEFGPNTCRPHFHILFFGLPKHAVEYFASVWQEDFGFTYTEHVNAVNPDGSNGFRCAAAYVGKYVSKGKFECDTVKDGSTFRPRILASKHLGTELDERLVSYFRAYDLFGKYDIETAVLEETGERLTEVQLRKLGQETSKRAFFVWDDYRYTIPNVIRKKLWYVKTAEGNYRSSTVQLAMSSFVDYDTISNYRKSLSECFSEKDCRPFVSVFSEFENSQTRMAEAQDKAGEEAYGKFLYSSIF